MNMAIGHKYRMSCSKINIDIRARRVNASIKTFLFDLCLSRPRSFMFVTVYSISTTV